MVLMVLMIFLMPRIRFFDSRKLLRDRTPPPPLGIDLRAHDLDLGAHGLDLGAYGFDLGAHGFDLGGQGLDLGAQGIDLGGLGIDSGAHGLDLGALGIDSGARAQMLLLSNVLSPFCSGLSLAFPDFDEFGDFDASLMPRIRFFDSRKLLRIRTPPPHLGIDLRAHDLDLGGGKNSVK